MSSPLLTLSRRELSVIVGIGVITTISFAGIVLCMWQIVDVLSSSAPERSRLMLWIMALAAAMAINAMCKAFEFNVTESIGYRFVQRLRFRIYDHMSGMGPRQIQHRSRGSLILRLTGDLSMLRTWISRGIGRGIISLFILVSGVAILAYMHIWLAVAVVWIFALGTMASFLLGSMLQRRTARVRRRRSELTSNIDEQVAALAVVQISGRSRGEAARLSKQNDMLTEVLLSETSVRGWLRAISTGTGWIAIVMVLAVGGSAMFSGQMGFATLIAATTVVRHMTGPARTLGFSYDYWRRAQVSRKKILDFLNSSSRDLREPGKDRLVVRKGRIDLDNVSVENALQPLTVTVQPGEHILITGGNGSGKSTLLSVIAQLQMPTGGAVSIDGVALSDVTLESTFRNIGMVSNDLPLMRGTLFRNLTYRKPNASDDEIRRVMLTCQLDRLIAEMPNGVSTWITEGGKNLSMGQRQLLALARAILGNPPILLLDEPTTNLDADAKALFYSILSRYNGTVIMASHDAEAVSAAHQIWLLNRDGAAHIMSGQMFSLQRSARKRTGASLRPVT